MKSQSAKIFGLKIIRQTPLAILFEQNKIQSWLPRSQIDYMKTESEVTEITIPEWLAFKSKFDFWD